MGRMAEPEEVAAFRLNKKALPIIPPNPWWGYFLESIVRSRLTALELVPDYL